MLPRVTVICFGLIYEKGEKLTRHDIVIPRIVCGLLEIGSGSSKFSVE